MLLERWSSALVEIRGLFTRMDTTKDGRLSWEEFEQGWAGLFVEDDPVAVRAIFDRFDAERNGSIDAIEWTTELRVEQMAVLAADCRDAGPFASVRHPELKLKIPV